MMSRPELTILWTLVLVTLCQAGPINRQNGLNTLDPEARNLSNTEQNVCVNDDVLYQPGDSMPAPTPCLRCVCNPPDSQCTPVACEKRPGCKALLRPNQCCPEYQCECERNGRLYANGERLDNAENPCQACYCQGGEVVCTTVECYRRDDCEPQFVPGRCCPKYDHCPPLVMDDARYGEPFVAGDRPNHTRASFQPSSGLDGDADAETDGDDDDQALGASSVQEHVHLPQESVATATTTPVPPSDASSGRHSDAVTTDAPASTDAATDTPVVPVATDASVADEAHATTDTPTVPTPVSRPQDTPREVAIKINVPAVPWTETPEPTAATTMTAQTLEEGSGAADEDTQKNKKEEPVIGVIERIGFPIEENEPTVPVTEEAVADLTTVGSTSANGDATEAQTEGEPITRLFMLSKEAELDPTTVSTEYTDIPEEMSTTPEVSAPAKDSTVAQEIDLSTEAFIETTTLTKGTSQVTEATTDSSPEFKDFDEWSGSKSSEFLRDSTSTGLSGGSSSSSDSHSKPAGSGSDESTSHFFATNINSEKVKLSSDNSALPHSEGGSTDSTESAESTEESATTEISSSTESENPVKILENTDNIPEIALDESDSTEKNPENQNIDEEQSQEKTKNNEKFETRKSDDDNKKKERGQPDIVLDTEATDENGPPILLIGEEIANHQMDIIVATSSTEEAETETPDKVGELEMRVNLQETTLSPTEAADVATESATDQSHAAAKGDTTETERTEGNPEETRAKEPADATEVPITDTAETQNEPGVTGSGDAKDTASSTEKLEAVTTAEDIMLSDDPLPGQAASAETVGRDENLERILGKTEQNKEETAETQKEEGDRSAIVLTTLLAEKATEESVNLRQGDLQTEYPEEESTTSTAYKEETPSETKYGTNIAVGKDDVKETGESKPIEIENSTEENIAEHLDVVKGTNQATEEQPSTESAEGNRTTIEYQNTQRTDPQTNAPITLDEGGILPNEGDKESVNKEAIVRAQSVDDLQKENTGEELKVKQSPEEPSFVTTTVSEDTITPHTEVPLTQYPVTAKSDNINIGNEDIMLGDQPLSAQSASKLQSTEEKEQKKNNIVNKQDEDKRNEQKESDNTKDKIQTIEPEQESERKEVSNTEPTQITESDVQTESVQTTVLEQNTEPQQKTEYEKTSEQDIVSEKKTESGHILDTAQEPEATTEQREEEVHEQKIEVPNHALVDSTNMPTNEEIVVKVVNTQVLSSDELSTPPPDTTISDAKIQEDSATSLPAKGVDSQETITSLPEKSADSEEVITSLPVKSAATDEDISKDSSVEGTTVASLHRKQEITADAGIKINPEVLELISPATVPGLPTVNGTVVSTLEPDATTLSPEWLKSDNNTKEVNDPEQKEHDKKDEDDTVLAGPVTENQASSIGDLEAGEPQRVERRADETDKKDLFLLEDFFTKLYRHQIATDANKEH